jgi:hypothetical protein
MVTQHGTSHSAFGGAGDREKKAAELRIGAPGGRSATSSVEDSAATFQCAGPNHDAEGWAEIGRAG